MKAFSYALAILAFALTASAPPAQAQQAPAAAQEKKPSWMEYKNPYVGEQNSLSNPNRSTDEILLWTRETVADALTFTPADMDRTEGKDNKLNILKNYFSGNGWSNFGQYMKESRFLDMVMKNRYNASTIVDGTSSVISSGVVAGSYRWVVQVPLLVTFHQVTRVGEVMPITSGHFILTMQVGRVSDGKGRDGLMIDSWKMQQVRK